MKPKDYGAWNVMKAQLELQQVERYFYEREVWWVALGANIGFEEDGKGAEFSRPVVILRKYNAQFFLGVPLSATSKSGQYYYHFETSPGYQTALLSQIRALDARRLLKKSGVISDWDSAMIRRWYIEHFSR